MEEKSKSPEPVEDEVEPEEQKEDEEKDGEVLLEEYVIGELQTPFSNGCEGAGPQGHWS